MYALKLLISDLILENHFIFSKITNAKFMTYKLSTHLCSKIHSIICHMEVKIFDDNCRIKPSFPFLIQKTPCSEPSSTSSYQLRQSFKTTTRLGKNVTNLARVRGWLASLCCGFSYLPTSKTGLTDAMCTIIQVEFLSFTLMW